MPRSIWNGALSFGLVNVPVQLFSAVEQKDIAFHEFQAGTGARIRHKRVSEKTGREVDYSDIEKGYETSKGKYVMLTREELESVEPGQVADDRHRGLRRARGDRSDLLRQAVLPRAAEGRGEAVRAVARRDGGFRAGCDRALRHAHQAVPRGGPRRRRRARARDDATSPTRSATPKALNVPKRTKVPDKELRIAEQLIDSMTVAWKPERYEDTYRARVLDLIRRKGKGQEIEVEKPEREEREVVDLVEALQRSLDAKAKGRPAGPEVDDDAKSTRKRLAPRPGNGPGRADCPQD